MDRGAVFGSRALTLGEVAQAYGVTPKVLRSWFEIYGLGWMLKERRSRYFTPLELAEMVRVLGSPESHRDP